MSKFISISQINPKIRYASYHQLQPGYDSGFRYLRHYQIIYVTKGKGRFITDGGEYIGGKGDLFFWSSKEAHRVISSKESPLTVYGLQFDITREAEDIKYPISWVSRQDYNASIANEDIKLFELPNMPNIFHLENLTFYENLFFELVKEYRSKLINSIDICESILKTLIIYTLQNHLYYNKSTHTRTIEDIIQYIYDNIEKKLTNEIVSAKFNYHKNHLNRLFKKSTQLSLHQFIMEAKLNKSIELMQSTDLTLTQISDRLAYSSLQHFSKQFKAKMGVAPSIFL